MRIVMFQELGNRLDATDAVLLPVVMISSWQGAMPEEK
jgi:hypothetical protein